MKKISLITISLLCACLSFADDYEYPYLIFTNSDGSQAAMNVDQLEITFSDGKLVATNGSESKSLTLADLAKMQFSTTNEGITEEIVTGIDSESIISTQPKEIYDISGRRAYRQSGSQVRRGVYIVRDANGKTSKIAVK